MLVDCKIASEIDLTKNKYSQKGEELIIQNIFEQLKINTGFCVEFGAYNGTIVSNTKVLRDKGWNSCLVDCEYFGNDEVHVYKLNANNINNFFISKNVPINFELLSVDIDGNDIYLVEKMLTVFSPKIIVVEFNRFFEKGISKAVEYDENFSWEGGTIYYGASYSAFDKMLEKYGYKIGIVQEQNLYCFRRDIEITNEQTSFVVHSDQPSLKNLNKFVNF